METQVYIPTNRGTRVVQSSNIVRIEASSNYSKLFFKNDRPLTIAKVLHWFEDKLEEDFFYRINRTHIVNRQFICAISPDQNILTLVNGDQLKISRRRKVNVLKMLV